MSIEDIENPEERLIAFIEEREAIRLRRANGHPKPWTQERILQYYRFTNIHREHDKVSLHYQKTIRDQYGNDSLVLPGTVFYRWFNRPETCDAFFNEPNFANQSVFEQYIVEGDIDILMECLSNIPPPHVTGAFIITGRQGYPKGEGVIQYFHEFAQNKDWDWREIWETWMENNATLKDIYDWLNFDGLGSFMRAQIVADLKYLPNFKQAEDWWTWAAPGPGSKKGLNLVLGYEIDEPWREDNWLEELNKLNDRVTPKLAMLGIDKLHNQDLQNCLCEFSKFEKTRLGIGRPRQVFAGV